MPVGEAARGYPVRLARAQVTFVIPGYAVFLMDSTDGIYVNVYGTKAPPLVPGDLVSMVGVTASGDLATVIANPHFRILGRAPLPVSPSVNFDRLTTGSLDCHLVSVEGIVRSVRPLPPPAGIRPAPVPAAGSRGAIAPNTIITLASGQDLLYVSTANPDGKDHRDLVDAKVRMTVVVGSRFNQRRQLIGIRAFMQDFSFVRVEEKAPGDPFLLPLIDTAGVMRFNGGEFGHRVRVRGVVTSTWGAQQFSIMDAKHGIIVHSALPADVRVGDELDVAGFPSWGEFTSVLDDAVYRPDGTAQPPAPAALTAAEALKGEHDAEPVQMDGELLYRSRTPSGQKLLLTQGGSVFAAALPADAREDFSADLRPGSVLRIHGICYVEVDSDKSPRSLTILLRSHEDIAILRSPSWWNLRHTLTTVGILLCLFFGAVGWNTVLRRRVRAQTQVIGAQIEDLTTAQKQLQYQASHDFLTGLWNRRALLEMLHLESERAARNQSPVGILILDVDHFKAVNDRYGHLTGDVVLQEIAGRIRLNIRPYDVAGRYGGEEFLVILPGCDPQQAMAGAERIRKGICDSQFQTGSSAIPLTVSIGASVNPGIVGLESDVLSAADRALYAAKRGGRNRTTLHDVRLASEAAASSGGPSARAD